MRTQGGAGGENGVADPLAEVFLGGPYSPQRLGVLRILSAEVSPRLAQRHDSFVLASSAGPYLAQKTAGSAVNSMKTSRRTPELPDTQVGRDYHVRLVCPHCFSSKWVLKRDLGLTLEEVLNTFWEFECPVHGPLREKPFEASQKKPAVKTKRGDSYAAIM